MGPSAHHDGRRGLQTEVLLGLCLVMATAAVVLALVGLRIHDAQVSQLRELAARGVVEEARTPFEMGRRPVGSEWWLVRPDGSVVARGGAGPMGSEAQELAAAARQREESLFLKGAPWDPLLFAVPGALGDVTVARIPAVASAALLAGLVVGAVAVFTVFGWTVLRGRVLTPLQRLATAVRAVEEGRLDARVPEEGVRETAAVARAFNEMAGALAARTRALEKAVADLRESNRSLRTAREGLDRAERLAAVGRMAAGVAHEVGNPLGAILALLDLVGREPELSESGRSYVTRATREGERVRVILRGLLDFSRPARGEPSVLDVGRLAEETVDLVRAQRRYGEVELRVEAESHLPSAFADRGAVAQILLNLVLNAADAARSREGGHVVVRVQAAPARPREGEGPAEAGGRRRLDAVAVRVEDDGPGVAPENCERIFDPFFSTKEPGEGTGLGLSNALRLAEQVGGHLDLDRGWGPGAAFVLRLPVPPAVSHEGSAVRDA